jgi:hypothetical protein
MWTIAPALGGGAVGLCSVLLRADGSPARAVLCLARAVRHMGLWRAQLGWRVVCVVGGASTRRSSLSDACKIIDITELRKVKGAAYGHTYLPSRFVFVTYNWSVYVQFIIGFLTLSTEAKKGLRVYEHAPRPLLFQLAGGCMCSLL